LNAAREAVSNIAFLPKCTGPISYIGKAELDAECATFKAAYASHGQGASAPFVTAASPGILASIVKNEHYPNFEAYLDAIAAALRAEYETIVGAGFQLQIDAPDLALERHASFRSKPLKDFQGFVERVIAAINAALVNAPRDKVRLHVCWGNYEGPHDHDVPLADILPLLRQAKVGGLYLPFANPRHAHEYKVLQSQPLPENQVLVAGVIDTVTNYIEHPEVVADRAERIAAAFGDPERVLAGTDCGFDTSAGMGRVAEDIVWAKLGPWWTGPASLHSACLRERQAAGERSPGRPTLPAAVRRARCCRADHYLRRGSSLGSTYVTSKGPKPLICTTASPSAQA